MYFPNAFKKVFPAAVSGGAVSLRTSGSTKDLTAGEIGLFSPTAYTAISAASGSNQKFIIAMGSYHTNDKLGGTFHGGYLESSKTKEINPKYVSRFIKIAAASPVNQIVAIGWDAKNSGSNNSTFTFECGMTYRLRIDIKGSPALRLLSHNIYYTVDAYTGCCDPGCNSGCTGDSVDQASVLLQWKDAITRHPYLSKFVSPKVYIKNASVSPAIGKTEVFSAYDEELNPSNTAYVPNDNGDTANDTLLASLELTAAYVDTTFGNCTFTVSDHYELQPIQILASITDETGNPCAIYPDANSSTGNMVTETQAPVQASGSGETLVRDFALSEGYRQEFFHDGSHIDQFRMRELEENTPLTAVSRSTRYDHYLILHNVPRNYNPTGTFDNDQYLIDIAVPAGTTMTSFTTLVSGILTNAGMGVTLETY